MPTQPLQRMATAICWQMGLQMLTKRRLCLMQPQLHLPHSLPLPRQLIRFRVCSTPCMKNRPVFTFNVCVVRLVLRIGLQKSWPRETLAE